MIDKGNDEYLKGCDAQWERQCEAATMKEEWVENEKEVLMKALTIDDIDNAFAERESTPAMVTAYQTQDWTLLGSLMANHIDKFLYDVSEINYQERMT